MPEFRRRSAWLPILLALAVWACGSEDALPRTQPPPAVTVVRVVEIPVDETLEFVGQTEAYRHVDLRARVEGVLERRDFREGQDVEEGQLLFVIEPAPHQAEVERLTAELARNQASLARARQELERAEALFKKGAQSQDRYDDSVTGEAEAAANVQASEAALRRAELSLGYTEIHAPVSGRVGRVNVNVGNLVGPGTGVLASISQLDPMYVTFSVSERTILDREQESRELEARGESIVQLVPRLRLSNRRIYEAPGEFDFIGETVDETTGSVPVRAIFPNPEAVLRPGQYVTVVIHQAEPVQRMVVPQAAIQENQEGYFVLVVDEENHVEARSVVAGNRYQAMWIIESGLSAGERVIVEGIQKVRAGLSVAPTERPRVPAESDASADDGA